MKRIFAIFLILLVVASTGCIGSGEGSKSSTSPITSQSPTTTKEQTLVVYSYDSFQDVAKATIPKFEKKYHVKVKLITLGDAGKVLNRLILEKDHPQADVVVGIDNSLAAKAIEAGILETYKPVNIKNVPEELVKSLDPTYHLVPYDYGAIAIIYKKDKVKNPPRTFEDLLKPKWRKSLIVEDPRLSSTGMAFLLWTIGAYGDPGWLYYWEKLKPQIYQIVNGWDAGWEMWDKGEAPLFVSYATDPAYDSYYHNNSEPNIGAILLNGTAYVQIEGAGIVKGTKHRELAEKFIEFLLTDDFQREIPTHNWMFPAIKNATLPEAYKYAVKPEKVVNPSPEEIKAKHDLWVKEWVELMIQGKTPEEIIKERGGSS